MSTQDKLRACAGCAAHLVTCDGTSQDVYCTKCYPKYVTPYAEWVSTLKAGDTVYLQPYAAWRELSHSRYLIIARDGDDLTVQILGVPKSRITTTVHHIAQHDVTPRRTTGALE